MCVIKCARVLTCVLCVHNKSKYVCDQLKSPPFPSQPYSLHTLHLQKHMCVGTTWVCLLCKGRHFHSPGVLQLVAGARTTQVLRPSVVDAECVTVHWMQIFVVIIIIF